MIITIPTSDSSYLGGEHLAEYRKIHEDHGRAHLMILNAIASNHSVSGAAQPELTDNEDDIPTAELFRKEKYYPTTTHQVAIQENIRTIGNLRREHKEIS